MGVNYTYFTVLGFYVPFEPLVGPLVNKSYPSCSHSEEERAGRFCSKCGVEVRTCERTQPSELQSDLEEYLQENNAVLVTNDYQGGYSGFLIGKIIANDQFADHKFTEIPLDDPVLFNEIVENAKKILRESPLAHEFAGTVSDIKMYTYVDVN